MGWSRRRLGSSIGSALAIVVLPLALTTASPTTPASDLGEDAPRVDVLDALVPDSSAPLVTTAKQAEQAAGRKDEVEVSSPKGTRVWSASALASHDLPVAAKRAYRAAAALMARTDPGCRLPWTLLAGIGRVESDHGRYGGSRLGDDGVSHPHIIGVQLNGAGPVAAIRDTEDGTLDGDRVWDRAVGPMQFIPSTWDSAARDGDGDGRRSPHDLDDAAAAAASYLCAGSGSLLDPAARSAAVYRYNQDDYYVALVLAFEVGYRTGVFDIPAPPVEEEPSTKPRRKRHRAGGDGARDTRDRRRTAKARPGKDTATDTAPKPPTTTAPDPKPAPTPTPKPSPAPPQPTTVTAVLTQDAGGTYLLGGKALDLGIVGQLDAIAVGDFDKDGAVEKNAGELAGMLGQQVTMVIVQVAGGKYGIHSINGISLG